MSWQDFFYFSKGERNALIVLLGLITIAGIVLLLTDSHTSDAPDETAEVINEIDLHDTLGVKTVSESLPVAAPSRKEIKITSPKNETVSERVKRLTSSSPSYPKTEKYTAGTIIELNSADTTALKKIPGIGTSFANRIVKYRNLLGGFYSVIQLSEVYGIDEDKYNRLAPWFTVDVSLIKLLPVNSLPQDSLRKHPYITYQQAKAISQLRRQKKIIEGWENLQLLDEFAEHDLVRLKAYLSFE